LSPFPFLNLALSCLGEAYIIDCNGSFRRKAGKAALRTLRENADFGVAKEKTADDLSVARNHRDCEITSHRQMSFRHSLAWRVLAVAGILRDIRRPNNTRSAKRWCEYLGIARHWKLRKRIDRRTGKRVEHVALAGIVDDVVEESPEFGARKLDTRIGDYLNQALQIGFDCQC